MSIFLQKLIIETPWLFIYSPKSDDARWSRISFDVNCSPSQAPSVKSVGITGQLTGSRADLMILDDVEVPGNSMTEMMRKSSYNFVRKLSLFLHQRKTPALCTWVHHKQCLRSTKNLQNVISPWLVCLACTCTQVYDQL